MAFLGYTGGRIPEMDSEDRQLCGKGYTESIRGKKYACIISEYGSLDYRHNNWLSVEKICAGKAAEGFHDLFFGCYVSSRHSSD